jgi:hypothetical protein
VAATAPSGSPLAGVRAHPGVGAPSSSSFTAVPLGTSRNDYRQHASKGGEQVSVTGVFFLDPNDKATDPTRRRPKEDLKEDRRQRAAASHKVTPRRPQCRAMAAA